MKNLRTASLCAVALLGLGLCLARGATSAGSTTTNNDERLKAPNWDDKDLLVGPCRWSA